MAEEVAARLFERLLRQSEREPNRFGRRAVAEGQRAIAIAAAIGGGGAQAEQEHGRRLVQLLLGIRRTEDDVELTCVYI